MGRFSIFFFTIFNIYSYAQVVFIHTHIHTQNIFYYIQRCIQSYEYLVTFSPLFHCLWSQIVSHTGHPWSNLCVQTLSILLLERSTCSHSFAIHQFCVSLNVRDMFLNVPLPFVSFFFYCRNVCRGSPGGSVVKSPPASEGRRKFDLWSRKIP